MFILLLTILVSISSITILNRLIKCFLLFESRLTKKDDKVKKKASNFPKVAIHIAISNEDPSVVKRTLSSLLKLEYPDYVVFVIDNNTNDEKLWIPVKKFCSEKSELLRFYHVEKLKGFKAGALEYALKNTPKDYELIAIVDADNIVRHDFLKDSIPYFSDKSLAFVQSPLGFEKDPTSLKFQSWIFLIYRYFLSVYMPATNRFKCSPFIGSMGVIRRKYLENVGGWNGLYLTEDMELSYRIFARGYNSYFIDSPYGFSMPPSNLVNFQKQHFRWNFGNTQIWRDYLKVGFFKNWQKEFSVLRKVIFFSCQGIYINFYFIPFSVTTIFLKFLEQSHSGRNYFLVITYIIFTTIAVEIIGETIFFLVLGKYEKVSLKITLKNLTSWLALTFCNSYSTWAAIFKKSTTFDVTDKTVNTYKSWGQVPIPELILTSIMFAIIFLPPTSNIFNLSFVSIIALLLGIISSMTLLLFIRGNA